MAGAELGEGDSFCWRKLFTAAEAEWEGSQLGSSFNWCAPEHECESDPDGATGTVTSISPVAVRWSRALPCFLSLILSKGIRRAVEGQRALQHHGHSLALV